MQLALTRICIFTVSGGDEECPLKEMVLAMAKYLTRPCPRCNGYLGIVLREAGGNTPLQASNGREAHSVDHEVPGVSFNSLSNSPEVSKLSTSSYPPIGLPLINI